MSPYELNRSRQKDLVAASWEVLDLAPRPTWLSQDPDVLFAPSDRAEAATIVRFQPRHIGQLPVAGQLKVAS